MHVNLLLIPYELILLLFLFSVVVVSTGSSFKAYLILFRCTLNIILHTHQSKVIQHVLDTVRKRKLTNTCQETINEAFSGDMLCFPIERHLSCFLIKAKVKGMSTIYFILSLDFCKIIINI